MLYGPSKAALLRQLRAVQDRLDDGVPVLDARRSTAEFFTYWAREILPGTISDSTLMGYRYIVRRDIVPYIGRVPLATLGPEHVHVMLPALEACGLSPRPSPTPGRSCAAPYGWPNAVGWSGNSAAVVDAPRQHRRETEYLSPPHVQQLIAAADSDPFGALYVLAVTTGLRRGEALGLL